MPSKGVQVYTYIAVADCTIELSVPKQSVKRSTLREFQRDDLEVDTENIDGLFGTTGRFSFSVRRGDATLTEQWVDVNALTGHVGEGTMTTIAATPSVVAGDVVVSYGFYAAGSGHAGLPDRHQCYVTVTSDSADWLARVAAPGSAAADQPFRRLVLPAPHDMGMNSMASCAALLAHAGSAALAALVKDTSRFAHAGEIADAVARPAVAALAPNIVASLAITQKDAVDAVLRLGARYFEFRPAHCHHAVLPALPKAALADTLYFQHGAIPGMAYSAFLTDLVRFLAAHPLEIVVVQLRWDGVPDACRRPAQQDVAAVVAAALADAAAAASPNNPPLTTGTLDDLRSATIAQLRAAGKRLLVLENVDSLSTYSDEANATVTGDSIVAAFGTALGPLTAQAPPPLDRFAFVNIQCQATATNIPGAVVASVLSASASNSCLLATKALCDAKTLPWVRDHALAACGDNHLVVVMNDFFDGATADVAIELSRKRLA